MLSWAILAYIVYLILFALINTAIIYHIRKYRYPHDVSQVVMVIYFAAVITLVLGTFVTLGVF